MNESIFNKIWNYAISVGQIITTFLIGRCCTRDVAVRTDFPAVERLIFLR